MTSDHTAAFAVIVPCFNEAPVINGTLRQLGEWFPEAQVIVVDDGSRDGTADVAVRFAANSPRTQVIVLERNGGKGQATAAAGRAIDAARVVIVDADLAYGRDAIARAVATLDSADLVIGNRRHHASTYTVPVRLFGYLYRRHLLGLIFNAGVRLLLGLPHLDTQCGLKGFRTETFTRLMPGVRTARFAFDLELLLLARAYGCRVVEIPVDVRYDSGRTSVKIAHDGLRMLRDVVALALRRSAGVYRRPAERYP